MKFVTDDGEEFYTVEEAQDHERWMEKNAQFEAEVADYHKRRGEELTERTMARDRRIIMNFLRDNLEQRPWRYEATADNVVGHKPHIRKDAPVPVEKTDAA